MNGKMHWLLYAIAALATVLVIITWLQISRIESFSSDLRMASLEACERNNTVREVLREFLASDQKQSERLPPDFFPGIPPDEFKRLIEQGARQTKVTVHKLVHVGCEAVIPEQ